MSTATSAAAASAAAQTLTPAELEQAHLFLEQTRCGMTGAIKGLSETQWTFKPAADRWSIAEISEHVIFVLTVVYGRVMQQLPAAPPPPADRDCAHMDSIVINQFGNRLAKFPAPEFVVPAGRLASAGEALEQLAGGYAGLRNILDTTPDLRHHAMEAPPMKAVSRGQYDWMDGYQWILAAAAHTERHTKQILEVMAEAGFPRR